MFIVAVIGLGYVGLPLVVEFGRHMRTIGFDILADKVARCRAGTDPSREIPDAEMALAVHAEYTTDPQALAAADFVIVVRKTALGCWTDDGLRDWNCTERRRSDVRYHSTSKQR